MATKRKEQMEVMEVMENGLFQLALLQVEEALANVDAEMDKLFRSAVNQFYGQGKDEQLMAIFIAVEKTAISAQFHRALDIALGGCYRASNGTWYTDTKKICAKIEKQKGAYKFVVRPEKVTAAKKQYLNYWQAQHFCAYRTKTPDKPLTLASVKAWLKASQKREWNDSEKAEISAVKKALEGLAFLTAE